MPKYIELAPQLVRLYRLDWDCKEVIKEFLLTAVTADVRKNIHAHWKPVHLSASGVCSACGSKWQFAKIMSFCPHCGAVMDERSENGD